MGEQISYLFLYLAEAVIAWLYFDYLFHRKRSLLLLRLTFPAGYIILFFIHYIELIAINETAFFFVNILLLLLNYHCKGRTAVLHSAFLTSALAITESIAALFIRSFQFPIDAYANNLSILIVMTIISKFMYFALTVIVAEFLSRIKSEQEEPSFIAILYIFHLYQLL